MDYENLGGGSEATTPGSWSAILSGANGWTELLAGCRSALPELPWDRLLEGDSPEKAPFATHPSKPRGKVKILFLAANPTRYPES